jgi:hypothetical protein
MKAMKFSLIAGALLASAGAAHAQPAERGRGAEVTRDQAIARAEARFARLDANRDGSLTREEMRAGRQQQQAERQARRQARIAQLPRSSAPAPSSASLSGLGGLRSARSAAPSVGHACRR